MGRQCSNILPPPPPLGARPKGRPLGALVLSLPLYGLMGGALALLSVGAGEAAVRPTVAVSLEEGLPMAAPPPPSPGGGAPAARREAAPLIPAAEEVPVAAPASLPTVPAAAAPGPGGGAGPAGGAPGAAPGLPGGVAGGQVGGVPGGQPDGVLPPVFDAAYLQNPAPDYPPLSRRLGEEGRLVLRVRVGVDGRAEELEIRTSTGHPRLDQAGLQTVRRWRFAPARRGAERVTAWVLIPITFNLDA
ncbi:energy transducer TonB [Mesoterricola silvestris]|uniref:TonB C-terminal domain-containing protein n=1 Tax=Mesoterricola silvestris TaxID=2927979 RepID=A0AA48GUY2_9BACT|nr:energy transducer TonB [Mesoterricola silvestris]BDU72286.1 hypothetical protein METEAL_14600 [Mesoterricola silvestris]